MLIKLIGIEIIKIFGKKRSLLGFLALAVLMPLIIWGFSKGATGIEQDIMHQLEGSFIIIGSIFNGFLVTYITMNFLWVHIPFLVMLVAGDVVAGEGAAGTFRIILIRRISRFKILIAKLIATYIYTIILILFFAIMSLGLGSLWLGIGDLVVFDEGILILAQEMVWGRFALAFILATFVMLVVATLCFMFSSMVNNGIGPIVGAMAIIIIGLAIANIPIDIFEKISPYIFTSYFDIWQKAFFDPIPWNDIANDAIILTIYMSVFIVISTVQFLRKDIST
ncbi:MAG: ABC transporter permease [Candidatus Neomarinimicrobiota bacterium]